MCEEIKPEQLSLEVAKNVIDYAIKIGRPVDIYQLQAILWTLHYEHLRQGKGLLINTEKFEAWQLTPVLRSVQTEYSIFGDDYIKVEQRSVKINDLDQGILSEAFELWSDVTTYMIFSIFSYEPAFCHTDLKSKISNKLITHYQREVAANYKYHCEQMKLFNKVNENLVLKDIEEKELEEKYTAAFLLLINLPFTNHVMDMWYKEERSKLKEIFSKIKEEYNRRV